MTCEEFRGQLTAFGLGELGPDAAAAARAHVAGCSACAAAVLADRQLTALLRRSVVPLPRSVGGGVRAALRAEAARRRPGRRRHWLALGAAAGLAAAVAAAALLLVPAPDRASPLAAAWRAYETEATIRWTRPTHPVAEQLFAVIGPDAQTPDLRAFGLRPTGWGARELADHLAAVAEFRDAAGHRVAVVRWRGALPRTGGIPAVGGDVHTATWGATGTAWWEADGVVWCLIGTVDQPTLQRVAASLYRES
jgi:anti-sigma factor RsiW